MKNGKRIIDSLSNLAETVYLIILFPFKELEASDLTATQTEIAAVASVRI